MKSHGKNENPGSDGKHTSHTSSCPPTSHPQTTPTPEPDRILSPRENSEAAGSPNFCLTRLLRV